MSEPKSLIFVDLLQIRITNNWTASSEFGTYRLCEQRRFRRACASAQSRQNLRCSLIQAVSQEEPSDRKPDPWSLWMAGHAQLKFVMTECSKTQIRLTRLMLSSYTGMNKLSHFTRKPALCFMRTAKTQTSLRIHAVWSASVLFAGEIVQYLYLLYLKLQDSKWAGRFESYLVTYPEGGFSYDVTLILSWQSELSVGGRSLPGLVYSRTRTYWLSGGQAGSTAVQVQRHSLSVRSWP